MKRNVILMGGKTHVISLPSSWVKQNGVKKGQELEVKEELNKLLITTEKSEQKKVIQIESNKCLKDKLIKIYQLGYDEIKIVGNANIDYVQDVINNLMPGFEIINFNDKYITLRCLSEVNNAEFKNLLKRALLTIDNNKTITLRLINMCKRCINKFGYNNFNKSLVAYNLLCEIEKLASTPNKTLPKSLKEKFVRLNSLKFEDINSLQNNSIIKNLIQPLQELSIFSTN